MSKKRTLDSRIRASQTFASLTYRQRDLWQGLIAVADDQGRLPGIPAFVRSAVWPYDDILLKEVDADLVVLEEKGNIIRYEVDGHQYIQLVNWWKYQNSQWAGPSDYPSPSGWTDRTRYHGKGREIMTQNWDHPGGFTTAQETDKGTGQDSGQDSGEIDGDLCNDVNDNGNDEVKKNLAADAAPAFSEPPDEEPKSARPPKPKVNKSDYLLAMEHLEQVFVQERGCPPPDWKRKPKECQKRWRTPLGDMYHKANDDMQLTEALISQSVNSLKKAGLTFSAPDQIIKTFESLLADRNSGSTTARAAAVWS